MEKVQFILFFHFIIAIILFIFFFFILALYGTVFANRPIQMGHFVDRNSCVSNLMFMLSLWPKFHYVEKGISGLDQRSSARSSDYITVNLYNMYHHEESSWAEGLARTVKKGGLPNTWNR